MTRRVAIAGVAVIAALGLGACSAGELVAKETAQSAQQAPNLDAGRVDEVLEEVALTLDKADSALDKEA